MGQYERITIAGQDVLDEIAAHKAATVRPGRYAGTWDSDTLCAHQREMSNRGYLGAQIVESAYGFSLRYDSGLQNFGLIASSRAKQVDGSFEDAVRYAKKWQAEHPTRRYVTFTKTVEG